MDQNTELLLTHAGPPTRWEDEEKATNDVEQLRAEFRRRLYANGDVAPRAGDRIEANAKLRGPVKDFVLPAVVALEEEKRGEIDLTDESRQRINKAASGQGR